MCINVCTSIILQDHCQENGLSVKLNIWQELYSLHGPCIILRNKELYLLSPSINIVLTVARLFMKNSMKNMASDHGQSWEESLLSG